MQSSHSNLFGAHILTLIDLTARLIAEEPTMHTFTYSRNYCGPVQAVIFDWGGTTVDFGCLAPAMVFVNIFRRQGIEISMAQAREPMGMHKRDHISAIARMSAVEFFTIMGKI